MLLRALILMAYLSQGLSYNWIRGPTNDAEARCPGRYCGRRLVNNSVGLYRAAINGKNPSILASLLYSPCGQCDRGWRVIDPTKSSLCEKCDSDPEFYDKLYLGFIVLFALVAHWVCIDFTAKRSRFTKEVLIMHGSSLIEIAVSALGSLLVVDPIGTLHLKSCKVTRLSDWYTLLHNPTPNYETTLHCTQEAVYPLYTTVFIFYAFSVLMMLLLRPCLASKFLPGSVIILSVVSCAAHYAFKLNQSVKSLLQASVTDTRNAVILLGHWGLHAYGIVAVTELKEPYLHLSFIGLVPVPALFYIFTARFTDPARINNINEQS